jgi:hypothetical protein
MPVPFAVAAVLASFAFAIGTGPERHRPARLTAQVG